MKIQVQKGNVLTGEVAIAEDITYVVVFSNEGEPTTVIEQVGQNHLQVTHANDKTFPMILNRLGVHARAT